MQEYGFKDARNMANNSVKKAKRKYFSDNLDAYKSDPPKPWAGLFESRLTLTHAGLKVNRSINFSCTKMFFASCFLFSLRLFKFKKEGQII